MTVEIAHFGRVGHISAGKYNAVSSTVGRETKGGAPLLALFEKWPIRQPTPRVFDLRRSSDLHRCDGTHRSLVMKEPSLAIAVEATSRTAPEVAHPQLFPRRQLTTPRYTFPSEMLATRLVHGVCWCAAGCSRPAASCVRFGVGGRCGCLGFEWHRRCHFRSRSRMLVAPKSPLHLIKSGRCRSNELVRC